MKARALIDGAPFGSETVKAIGEVFDQTSVRIKMNFGNDHDAVEAARIRLVDVLRWAFFNLKKRAAPGVDGLTWVDYAADLERNLTDLHARVHSGAYRALPSRRKYIPKADGKQRPLGIATIASNCTSIPTALGIG